MAVMVAMSSWGQQIWAMIEAGIMTPPTPMDAKLTKKYIRGRLPGVEHETAPVKAVMTMQKK